MNDALFSPKMRGKDEHRTSNIEWEKMKKLTYDPEERSLEYSVPVIKFVEDLPNAREGN